MILDYDKEEDVLYISYGKPKVASYGKLFGGKYIVRFDSQDRVVGITNLEAKETLTELMEKSK